jgi:hypothetical protein
VTRRAAVAYAALGALLIVVAAGAASPAVHPDLGPRSVDLVSSAQPSSTEPVISDVAFDESRVRGQDVKADAVATTSATCDGCTGDSTTLQVLYLPRSESARLDNTATAWAQACSDCTATALSVQVVVLRGGPFAVPNNRALAVSAACEGCRVAAAAFQLVVVGDRAKALSPEALAELRAWVDEQSAALRAALVATPLPTSEPTPEPSPTIPTDSGTQATAPVDPSARVSRRARRAAANALGELEFLVTADLGAQEISSDVQVSH